MPLQATNIHVPILTFIGVEGGVGKTTLALRFARLITHAPTRPNVLLIDMDLNTLSNLTQKVTHLIPTGCSNWHECVLNNRDTLTTLMDIDSKRAIIPDLADLGKCYLLPACSFDARQRINTDMKAHPYTIEGLLNSILSRAIMQYNFSCVVINCGPTITPYAAAAVSLCDRGFWVVKEQNLKPNMFHDWIEDLHEFIPDIPSSKVVPVINQVKQGKLTNKDDSIVYVPCDSDYFERDIGPSHKCCQAFIHLVEVSFRDLRPDWLHIQIPQEWPDSYWSTIIPFFLRAPILSVEIFLNFILNLFSRK